MAEIIGIVASIAQLVHLSGEILTSGYGFIAKVSRAPSEIRELLTESAGLNCLLGHLQSLADASTPARDDVLRSLQRLGVFGECRDLLVAVRQTLGACASAGGEDAGSLGRRLKWPFKEREAKEAIQRLGRLRGLLSSAVDANSALALRRIEAEQARVGEDVRSLSTGLENHINRDQLANAISWLCPSPSWAAQERLESALQSRHAGTGAWLFESPVFKEWHSRQTGLLWITGLPGSGKSILCSTAVDHLQRSYQSSSVAVLFFFCDHNDQQKTMVQVFLASLIRQLVLQSEKCASRARQLYEGKLKDGGHPLNASEYSSLIRTFIKEFARVFIVVDALDEESDKESIGETLNDILNISSMTSKVESPTTSINILATSRLDVQVQSILDPMKPLRLELGNYIHTDVERYVKSEVQTRIDRKKLKLRDPNLASQIQSTITNRAGTFLQAKLQLDIISALRTDRDIRLALQNLPNGLEATYEKILRSIIKRHPTRVKDIKIILQWLVASATPLRATQLAEIVGIRAEDTFLDFDGVSTDPYDTVELISQLVVVNCQKEDAIVQLYHFSVEEYLCCDDIASGPVKDLYINRWEAHAKVAEMCLQYLSFSDFNIPVVDMTDDILIQKMRQYSLLRYAAMNWPMHLRNSRHSPSGAVQFEQSIKPRLGWFLNAETQPNSFNTWHLANRRASQRRRGNTYPPLCFALQEGLYEIVDILLPRMSDINQHFANGLTCLTAAAMGYEVSISQRLLDLGAKVDLPTNGAGLTALHIAAEGADEEMVQFLLSVGASVHSRSQSKTTPFYRAARGGSVSVLRILYENGSELDAKTWDNWTPLMEAVENGHRQAVELLLGWGADPGNRSVHGLTPSRLAQGYSHANITGILERALDKRIGGEISPELNVL